MFSNILISLLFGAGIAGWFYFKVMRRTGGTEVKSALLLVSLIGFIAFLVFFMFLGAIGRQ